MGDGTTERLNHPKIYIRWENKIYQNASTNLCHNIYIYIIYILYMVNENYSLLYKTIKTKHFWHIWGSYVIIGRAGSPFRMINSIISPMGADRSIYRHAGKRQKICIIGQQKQVFWYLGYGIPICWTLLHQQTWVYSTNCTYILLCLCSMGT